jgi:hypothetical protein
MCLTGTTSKKTCSAPWMAVGESPSRKQLFLKSPSLQAPFEGRHFSSALTLTQNHSLEGKRLRHSLREYDEDRYGSNGLTRKVTFKH